MSKSTTIRNQMIFWLGAFAIFLTALYLFKSILLPFVLGAAIAYLLNPLVHSLAKLKIARAPASLVILLLFLGTVGLCLTLLLPLLYRQGVELAENLPNYIDTLWAMLEPLSAKAMQAAGVENTGDIKALLQDHTKTTATLAQTILSSLAAGGLALMDAIMLSVFTPIMAYFMLKEWDTMTGWVEDLLPHDHKNTIMDLLGQMNVKISGFIRGQITVALILGIAYAVALSIAGLKYGFLIGLASGLLSVIPMVGSVLGLVVSVAVAWLQSGDITYVGIIAAIFFAGQLIEGNILSPKIVGDSVGLHPLWVFFALLAGGALLGVLGMLIAVPVAAIAGVLITFAITQYKSSPLYKGKAKPKTKPKPKTKTAQKK